MSCGFGVQEGSHSLAGVSRAVVLRVCAQQAQQLQAFKLARWAYTQLQALRIPPAWQVCLHAYTEIPIGPVTTCVFEPLGKKQASVD